VSNIPLGTHLQKNFPGHGVFSGTVIEHISVGGKPFLKVRFVDNDIEDMSPARVRGLLRKKPNPKQKPKPQPRKPRPNPKQKPNKPQPKSKPKTKTKNSKPDMSSAPVWVLRKKPKQKPKPRPNPKPKPKSKTKSKTKNSKPKSKTKNSKPKLSPKPRPSSVSPTQKELFRCAVVRGRLGDDYGKPQSTRDKRMNHSLMERLFEAVLADELSPGRIRWLEDLDKYDPKKPWVWWFQVTVVMICSPAVRYVSGQFCLSSV
jgi:hypothetical protein